MFHLQSNDTNLSQPAAHNGFTSALHESSAKQLDYSSSSGPNYSQCAYVVFMLTLYRAEPA